jgi:hypothetical protein
VLAVLHERRVALTDIEEGQMSNRQADRSPWGYDLVTL